MIFVAIVLCVPDVESRKNMYSSLCDVEFCIRSVAYMHQVN